MFHRTAGSWRQTLEYSNVLPGLVAVGFMLGTYAILDLPVHLPLLVLGGCGTFLVYQADRSLFISPEDRFNHPERISWARDHSLYLVVSSVVACGVAIAMLFLVGPPVRWFVGTYALAGAAYAIPGFRDRFRSTGVHLGKPVIVALGWSLGGVMLPVVQAGAIPYPAAVLLVLYRFGFVFPNPLLADWFDRSGDTRTGIFTPAAFMSATSLQQISQLVLVLIIAGAVVAIIGWEAPNVLWIDLLGPLFMVMMVSRRLSPARWFYQIALDGIVAWPAVTALVYFLW